MKRGMSAMRGLSIGGQLYILETDCRAAVNQALGLRVGLLHALERIARLPDEDSAALARTALQEDQVALRKVPA